MSSVCTSEKKLLVDDLAGNLVVVQAVQDCFVV